MARVAFIAHCLLNQNAKVEGGAKRPAMWEPVIELLQERLDVPRRGKDGLYHDLDHLFGTWTTEQAEEFDRILKEMREEEKRFIGK